MPSEVNPFGAHASPNARAEPRVPNGQFAGRERVPEGGASGRLQPALLTSTDEVWRWRRLVSLGPSATERKRPWIRVGLAAVSFVLAAGAATLWIISSRLNDPGIDSRRVADSIQRSQPEMERTARAVLADAASGTTCAPQLGAAPPNVPPLPQLPGLRAWCTTESDPTLRGRWTIDVTGVDPAQRCKPGDLFAVFSVPETEWGTPFVVYSGHCAPTSWFDGDPSYGRSFVPITGPWYAVRPLGAAITTSW